MSTTLTHVRKCERSPENTSPFIGSHPDDTRNNVQLGLKFLVSVDFTELDEEADCGLRLVLIAMRDALEFEQEHRPRLGKLSAFGGQEVPA